MLGNGKGPEEPVYYRPMTLVPQSVTRRRGLKLALVVSLWAALPAARAELPEPPKLDPARPAWTEVHFTGSKLFITARAAIRQQRLPATAIAGRLIDEATEEGRPVPAGSEVMEVVYEAGGLGRRSRIALLMDPLTGAALQREQHDYEGRLRYRVYRFTDRGAWHETRWPREGEETLPPAEWTERTDGLRPYPPEVRGEIMLEPTGLLYAVAAGPVAVPGDEMELLMFQRRAVHRVRVTADSWRELRTTHEVLRPGGTERPPARTRALRVLLQGEALDDEDDELELLGLRGRLELLIDPETRVPLQLSGSVKILGHVTLRLETVHMAR